MFTTRVHVSASHATLVACGTARQTIEQGDEPLGPVTALMYAGVPSIAGTMWPVASRTGRIFAETFYGRFKSQMEKGTFVDLAVVMQETVNELRLGTTDDDTGERNLDTAGPYHWAAFVLHGGWRV